MKSYLNMSQCLGLGQPHCSSEGIFCWLCWIVGFPLGCSLYIFFWLAYFVFTTNFTWVTFSRTVNFWGIHPEQGTRDVKYLFWITHMNNMRQIFQPSRQLPEPWGTSFNELISASLHFLWLSVWFVKCRIDHKYFSSFTKGRVNRREGLEDSGESLCKIWFVAYIAVRRQWLLLGVIRPFFFPFSSKFFLVFPKTAADFTF